MVLEVWTPALALHPTAVPANSTCAWATGPARSPTEPSPSPGDRGSQHLGDVPVVTQTQDPRLGTPDSCLHS